MYIFVPRHSIDVYLIYINSSIFPTFCYAKLTTSPIDDSYYSLINVSLFATGRHVEEQFNSERTRTGKRRRSIRSSDGRYGHRLRDRGMRVRLEKPEGRHWGTGEWGQIARRRGRDRAWSNVVQHAPRSRCDLPRYTARIHQLMFAWWWSSSLMVTVHPQNHSGLIGFSLWSMESRRIRGKTSYRLAKRLCSWNDSPL